MFVSYGHETWSLILKKEYRLEYYSVLKYDAVYFSCYLPMFSRSVLFLSSGQEKNYSALKMKASFPSNSLVFLDQTEWGNIPHAL
jgi:hypothetical protein